MSLLCRARTVLGRVAAPVASADRARVDKGWLGVALSGADSWPWRAVLHWASAGLGFLPEHLSASAFREWAAT